jgi:hypothetical protein
VIDREPRALAVVAKEIGLSPLEFPGRPWGEHHHQQRALGESMVDRPRRVEDIGSPKSLVGAFVVTTPVVLLRRDRRCWATPVGQTTPSRREIGRASGVGRYWKGRNAEGEERRVPCLHSWLGLLRRS